MAHVLWEIALREGCGLNTRFAECKLADDCTVWDVTDPDQDNRRFYVCLDGTASN